MALEADSWAVNGAQSSARIARLQLQSATRSGNGVIEVGDLQVLQQAVPGASVRVASGGAVVLGREATFQGSYYAFNVGDATVPIAATGSGAGRSDLVILRVEDPNISGTPWNHNPATDPLYYFRVLQGVSPGARDVPAGTTGVALARIDLPPSTSAVTQAMITDVRQAPDPRAQQVLRVQRGGTQTGGNWDEAGNATADFERWPQHEWPVTVPAWATQVQVRADWLNVFLKPLAPSGANDAVGQLRTGLVGSQSVFTTPSAYNFNQTSATNGYRCSAGNADQVAVPAALRGQSVFLRMYAKGGTGQAGRLVADAWANFTIGLQFLEVPAPGAQP